ncbi:Uncharacterised protein [Candidatus Anstonella stagnisolia]|nr:Uncharacterised protein [Candidatus Anstonella stagnisolia]
MCIEKKYWKGILVSAILFAIVAQVVNTLGAYATMGYYTDPAYFAVWSKLMMPATGAPPVEFFFLALLLAFASGIVYAGAYSILMKAIPGKTEMGKGISYGILLFVVAIVPGYLSMLLLLNLPSGLVASWGAESLVTSLIGGVLIAKFVK